MTAIARALKVEHEPDPDRGRRRRGGAVDDRRATILLENSAGSGDGLGVDLDELGAIADALAAAGVPTGRVKFFLDTAHAWSAGHDLADPGAIDSLLRSSIAGSGSTDWP